MFNVFYYVYRSTCSQCTKYTYFFVQIFQLYSKEVSIQDLNMWFFITDVI